MDKHILNFAFHILNISYLCNWSVIPLLVSYWLAWQASMQKNISDGGRRNLPSTIRIVKTARWSPINIHEVAVAVVAHW